MSSIAVIGARGFVGNALCEEISQNPSYKLVKVTRENYEDMQNGEYGILINCAMPSGRFWAKNNPEKDYTETVRKTEELHGRWNYKKFVQISTVSARMDQQSVYGGHKCEAEKICNPQKDLIIRLSSMYGPALSKGALIDILNKKKVFLSPECRYPFAPLDFVASWISRNLELTGIVEVGAKNPISLKEIADYLKFKIEFEGSCEDQSLDKVRPEFPDVKEVLEFMSRRVKGLKS